MNKIVLVLMASLLAAAAVAAAPASALCPINDPDCDPGGGGNSTHTVTRTLTVTAPSRGTITGPSVNCGAAGSDCTTSQSYTTTCVDFDCTRTPEDDQVVTLSWSGPAGFSPTWTGCTSGACNVLMNLNRTVSLALADVADPTVTLTGPPSEVRNAALLSATAADNDAVKRVEFYVDGALKGSDTSAPYELSDTTNYAHGSTHTATAKAVDNSDRESALSAGRDFTVDKQVNLSLGVTPAQSSYTNAAPASLSFSTDGDVAAAGKRCRVVGVTGLATCASPFAPALGDGAVTYEVTVTDDVGNTATQSRSFTIDRTVPTAAFTDGPGEGAEVSTSTVEISFDVADASPLTLTCKVDGGAFGACSSGTSHTLTGLAVGAHSLTVRAIDAAGNEKTITRSFAVKAQPTGTGTNTGTGTSTSTGTSTGTGTGTSTGGGGSSPGGKIDAKVTTFWRLFGKRTQIRTLTVKNAPVGSKVTVSCKGKGCTFKRVVLTVTGSKLALAKQFKKKRLAAGTVVTITVAKQGMVAKTFRYTLRAKRFPKLALS